MTAPTSWANGCRRGPIQSAFSTASLGVISSQCTRQLCDRDLRMARALGQLMRWQSACLAGAGLIPLTSVSCYQTPPPAAGCPAGHTSYQAGDVALRLSENDGQPGSSLRLPL